MNIKWNADEYDKSFGFVYRYGEELTELFTIPKGSRVIDLGCGAGNLTSRLNAMGYSVIGIDDSQAMLDIAAKNYSDIEFKKGNALDFKEEPVDGIFSNAVFHWIDKDKHTQLLNNIAANLKTGGELVCEFGGVGCAEAVHSTLEKIFEERGLKYKRSFYFPSIGEYAPVLENAGLQIKLALLFDRPTEQQKGVEGWIRMFNMAAFEGIEETEIEYIIRECEERLRGRLYVNEKWYVDYVRIRFKCVKK